MSARDISPDGLPVLEAASADEWRAWLEAHHADARGVWLKIAKKGTGVSSPTHHEGVRVALCYGWIDGQARSLDDVHWLQRFTPRRPRSKWSQKNCQTALELIASGEMRPAGLAAVEAARADGRWDAAYASPASITVPDDLQKALNRNRKAKRAFEALDSRNRYAILYRIHDAKREETRRRRIETFVAMLEAGEKLY